MSRFRCRTYSFARANSVCSPRTRLVYFEHWYTKGPQLRAFLFVWRLEWDIARVCDKGMATNTVPFNISKPRHSDEPRRDQESCWGTLFYSAFPKKSSVRWKLILNHARSSLFRMTEVEWLFITIWQIQKRLALSQPFLFKISECLFNLDALSLHIGMVRRANKWTTRCVREAKL